MKIEAKSVKEKAKAKSKIPPETKYSTVFPSTVKKSKAEKEARLR